MDSEKNKIYVIVKNKNQSILRFPQYNIETKAFIGRNGVTYNKKEGDGKTPLGEFELGIIFGMHEQKENKNYIKITKNMHWIDDFKSIYYNQLVNIKKVKKDWNTSEHLIEYPIQYEYAIEIKTNPKNIPKKGSAIFLHCDENKSTKGCIAINVESMEKIIKLINVETKILIYKGND